jgi:hypothetical protein
MGSHPTTATASPPRSAPSTGSGTPRGQLNPGDLLFLETFYRGLGKDIYKIPGYLKNDNNWIAPTSTTYAPGEIVPAALDAKTRAALAASDPFKVNVMPDRSLVQRSGRDADELAAFFIHAAPDERGGVVPSKRLAITAAQSVAAYQQLSAVPPPVPYRERETARAFLHLASNNEQAMHDLLTGNNMDPPRDAPADLYDGYKTPKDFLVPITTNEWSDDGKAAAETIDWIADAKRATDPYRQQLGDEAMDGVVGTLTDHRYSQRSWTSVAGNPSAVIRRSVRSTPSSRAAWPATRPRRSTSRPTRIRRRWWGVPACSR